MPIDEERNTGEEVIEEAAEVIVEVKLSEIKSRIIEYLSNKNSILFHQLLDEKTREIMLPNLVTERN